MSLNLGVSYLEQNNYIDAILYYQKCLEKEPEKIEYYWYLGVAYLLQGEEETANNLWMSIFLQGTSEELDVWTQDLIAILENFFTFYIINNKFFTAQEIFKTINTLADNYSFNSNLIIKNNLVYDFSEFWLQRAIEYARNKDFPKAEVELNYIIALQDAFNLRDFKSLIFYNLALLYLNSGRLIDSLEAINQAINLDNLRSNYFYLRGLILEKLSQFNNAILAYQNARRLGMLLNEDFFISLGYCFLKNSQCDLAINILEEGLRNYPNDLRLKRLNQAILPVIYRDTDELIFYRHRFIHLLNDLLESLNFNNCQTPEAFHSLQLTTNFFLGYQGKNDLPIQLKYGQYLENIVTNHYPRYCRSLKIKELSNRKIKVGYLSQRLQSMLGILTAGWVKFHNQEDFEIYSYDLGVDRNQCVIHDFEDYSDFYICLPPDIQIICEQVIKDDLDILVFPDLGMDPLVLVLATMRLAPIQCITWGHPITSGLKTIDYYLSSNLMEPSEGQAHYSEQLVRLPNLGFAVAQPIIPELTLSRRDFAIPEEKIMYLSCQSLFKYLPQFDYIYPYIAQQVPESIFVFISLNDNPIGNHLFQQRLKQSFTKCNLDSDNFCIIIPRSSHGRFVALNQLADIGLDTLGWSGGITTLHSLSCHLPVVTCPGEFMRGRHTYGILKMLGVTETIAYTEEEYIEIAVRLGQDNNWRQSIRQTIANYHHRLYNDIDCVNQLELFYKQVVKII